jgi:hypothetical protein
MKRHASNPQTPRVNILKKIKLDGAWQLLPAVLEPNGQLKDKVRIGGSIEIHSEGSYYLEWWEGPKRKREAIPDRARVPDLANRKALALAAVRAGLDVRSDALNRGETVTQGIPLDLAIQHYLDDIKPPQTRAQNVYGLQVCPECFSKRLREVLHRAHRARGPAPVYPWPIRIGLLCPYCLQSCQHRGSVPEAQWGQGPVAQA